MPKSHVTGLALGGILLALTACSIRHSAPDGPSPAASASAQPAEPYVIGLGEIMGLNQMRHAKLWFAGAAGNWPLAAYEIDEMREGFDDARHFHDHHKGVPQPLSKMIPPLSTRHWPNWTRPSPPKTSPPSPAPSTT